MTDLTTLRGLLERATRNHTIGAAIMNEQIWKHRFVEQFSAGLLGGGCESRGDDIMSYPLLGAGNEQRGAARCRLRHPRPREGDGRVRTHFRDPCIHCGVRFEDMQSGPCPGDASKAVPILYCVDRQAGENPVTQCDTALILTSIGDIREEHHHPSSHWSYGDRFKAARVLPRHEFYRRYMRPRP
jgi:hypothetical protein